MKKYSNYLLTGFMTKKFLVTLFFLISCVFYSSGIILPGVFSDNMVLQQNSDVVVWGWSRPSEMIKIAGSWNPKDTVVSKANCTGYWMTKLKTMKAGGPYTLTFCSFPTISAHLGSPDMGSNKIELTNVMLGEVWVCSGQSNMGMRVNSEIFEGEEEVAKANHPNIRFFQVPEIGADFPQQDCHATWTACSPETVRKAYAVGYFFGRALQGKLNVPVGLIMSAWGGTQAEVWVKKELIENNPVLKENVYDNHTAWWPSIPGTCYNGMIAPLIPYGIAGAIWYQGESNSYRPDHYAMLMKTLIENWRSDFGKEFPFYFVQIAPFKYGPNGKSWIVREQQELASKIVPNTGMVVVSDLVDNIKNIHPKNKLDVGKRLANYALAETYHQKMGAYKSPTYASMLVENGKIRIAFNNDDDGLKCTEKTPSKFLIAGDDHQFVTATAKIERNTVVVSAKTVKNPVAVRFCFDDTTMPDIFNTAGLPVAPFRTDNWEN